MSTEKEEADLEAFEVHQDHQELQAFEKVVLADLDQLRDKDERTTRCREWLDAGLCVLGFVLTAIMIWCRCQDWIPITGPVPIAGVAIRRMLHL